MKQKITVLVLGFLLTLGISSCVKDGADALGSRGNTIIKFSNGPTNAIYFSPFTDVKTVSVFTFRRDVNSAAELQKPVEFVLQEDATLIPAGYTELPASMYTLPANSSITVASGKINLRFAPGEFSKDFKILLNGAAWTSLGTKYAKGYKVFDAAGKQVSASQPTVVATFGIKNEWDGKYKVTGYCFHPSSPRAINDTKYLTTEDVDKCKVPLGDLYGSNYYFRMTITNNVIGGALNLGATPATFTFLSADNPSATNQGAAAATGNVIGAGEWVSTTYNNTYNPVTRTFWLHYSYGGAGAAREFYEKWERIN